MRYYFIDLSKMDSREAIHDYFEKMLELPDYYGRNLDALHDVISTMSAQTVFCIQSTDGAVPDPAKKLCAVLEDCAQENPYVTVKYV